MKIADIHKKNSASIRASTGYFDAEYEYECGYLDFQWSEYECEYEYWN